jgi:hypothetical protein
MIQYNDEDKKYLKERILLGKTYAIKSQFKQAFSIFDEVEKKAQELNYQDIIKKCKDLKKKYIKARNKTVETNNRVKLNKRLEYAKDLANFNKYNEALKISKKVKQLADKKNYNDIYRKSIDTISEIRLQKNNFNENH